jgi:hypothetical protein
MSQAVIEQVVGKLILDPEFRQRMGANMERALEGYDLTEGEIEGLKNIDLEDFHQSVSGLDDRLSKGRLLN